MAEKNLIDSKKLKYLLKNKNNFERWIKRNIEVNNLKQNYDYFTEKIKFTTLKNFNREKLDYYLTEQSCIKIISSQSKNKIGEKILSELNKGKKITQVLEEITYEEVQIITLEHDKYPQQLRKIKNPPKQLYIKGNLENLNHPSIAVIGSRDCSNYGRTMCKIFTNNLVGYNLNIVSGLAVGIDSVAHKTCIESKGKTIAVLPSGFNKIFPKENEQLVDKIIESGGTVITEYPPGFEKTGDSCRQRNRIMSGLSIATLVIEAEHRSGTSITVRYAKEQNKKTFCIPSSLLNSKGIGTNEMILEKRAQIVTKVEDIIDEFPELKLQKNNEFDFCNYKKKKKERSPKDINIKIEIEEENLDLYNQLSQEPKEIDQIAKELNKPVSEVMYKLTLLELQGVIKKLPGNKYKIK